MNIFYLGINQAQSELAQDAIDAIDELEFYARNHQKLKAQFYQYWATAKTQSEAIERADMSDSLLDLSHSVGLIKAGIAQKKVKSIESPCRANCWSF